MFSHRVVTSLTLPYFEVPNSTFLMKLKFERTRLYVMCFEIWYHLYNFKNVENTHGGVLLLVKPATLLKVTLLNGCFSRF